MDQSAQFIDLKQYRWNTKDLMPGCKQQDFHKEKPCNLMQGIAV